MRDVVRRREVEKVGKEGGVRGEGGEGREKRGRKKGSDREDGYPCRALKRLCVLLMI